MSVTPRKIETVRDFHGKWIDDGYSFMEVGRPDGWRPIAAWGRDGWDLGDWPLVVVMFREVRECRYCGTDARDAGSEPVCGSNPGREGLVGGHSYIDLFSRAIYVEGDIIIESYATRDDRERATDDTAFFYWRLSEELWIRDYLPGTEPGYLRGPYSKKERA